MIWSLKFSTDEERNTGFAQQKDRFTYCIRQMTLFFVSKMDTWTTRNSNYWGVYLPTSSYWSL